MGATNNVQVFSQAMLRTKAIIDNHVLNSLVQTAEALILDAEFEKEFRNLTGNTLTSYAVGIYYKWRLKTIISIFDVDSGIDYPTSKKLTNRKGYQKIVHYDTGDKIYVKTDTFDKTSEEYGFETSEEFLREYTPDNGGFALVMCTGTEYSGVLEFEGMNVLSETCMASPRIFLSNLKKIKL